jgi:hypothetical protein
MTNKYLEKIAGIAGLLSAAPKAAGRTIQAVKGADNVFKASTPLRDAVGFMKVNKKPLAIGAGLGLAGGMAAGPEKQAAEHETLWDKVTLKNHPKLKERINTGAIVGTILGTPLDPSKSLPKGFYKPIIAGGVLGGAAGALYHKIKGGQEKHANVNRHENLVAFGKAMEDPKNRNIIDASKIGIGAAYGGGAGFFANEYMHSRRVNKFMNTITPGNIAKATPSQLLDAVEGLDRIGAGKVPKPKLGRVGAVIGGGVMLGKVLHDRFTKKANYEENEMTNKYLEKIAAHYNLAPHSLDKGMYGTKSVSLSDSEFKKYQEGMEKAMPGKRLATHVGGGAAAGAAVGGVLGKILGGAKGKLAAPGALVGSVLGAGAGAGHLQGKAHDESLTGLNASKYMQRYAQEKQASEEDRGYTRGAAAAGVGSLGYGAANVLTRKLTGKAGSIVKSIAPAIGLVGGIDAGDKLGAKIYDKLNKQAAEKWIQGAIKHPGALHKALGVPADEKIPAAKLHAAAKKGGKIGREARLAETLKGLRHGKK